MARLARFIFLSSQKSENFQIFLPLFNLSWEIFEAHSLKKKKNLNKMGSSVPFRKFCRGHSVRDSLVLTQHERSNHGFKILTKISCQHLLWNFRFFYFWQQGISWVLTNSGSQAHQYMRFLYFIRIYSNRTDIFTHKFVYGYV